jgi:hypothetical protein
MRALAVATSLAACLVLSTVGQVFSEDRWELLTPAQSRTYHACLFEAWIQNYCHANSRAYAQCVEANGGGRYQIDRWSNYDSYCWAAAQSVPAR